MKHIHFLYVVAVFVLILPGACKSSRTASGDKGSGKATNASKLYESLASDDSYTWITGKARLRATTPEMKVSGSMQLRMVRDSIVWAMVEKFGFEVVRIMITPDSIFIVDRLNKEYTEEGLETYLDDYGLQLSFRDLQKTLIGRMITLVPESLDYFREKEFDILTVRDRSGVNARHWVAVSSAPKLMRSQFVDSRGRSLKIENLGWQTVQGNEIPYGRYLVLDDGESETAIEMTFSEIRFDEPTTLPFSIPAHYDRVR